MNSHFCFVFVFITLFRDHLFTVLPNRMSSTQDEAAQAKLEQQLAEEQRKIAAKAADIEQKTRIAEINAKEGAAAAAQAGRRKSAILAADAEQKRRVDEQNEAIKKDEAERARNRRKSIDLMEDEKQRRVKEEAKTEHTSLKGAALAVIAAAKLKGEGKFLKD
jgi:hypothetical protein